MSNKPIRILALDPALSELGWSLCYYDDKNKLHVKKTGVFKAASTAKKKHKEEIKELGLRCMTLYEIEEFIKECYKFKPDFVVCEDAFYNPRMPNAYSALVMIITAINRLLYYYHKIQMILVPTRIAKKNLVGKGSAKKTEVNAAVMNHDAIIISGKELSDHVTDSIAVAYSFVVDSCTIIEEVRKNKQQGA